MTREEIIKKATEIIVDKLGVDAGDVKESASFRKDFGTDSLDEVELMMEFEKEFNFNIPDFDAVKFDTVKDAIDYLEQKTL